MPLIIGIFIILAVSYLFPAFARVLAWILTIGFILPFCTFGIGSFAWALANIFTCTAFWGWDAWQGFCAYVGFPIGLLAAWWIHMD